MTAITGTTTGATGSWATPVFTSTTGSSPAVREPKPTLDKDAFLQLMVTQMRYQDPSSPMDTTQMMQQTSQMTTVEQLTTLVSASQAAFASQQQLSASGLIGKDVTWADADGVQSQGSVSAVRFTADGPLLRVGDADVPLGQLVDVRAAGATTTA